MTEQDLDAMLDMGFEDMADKEVPLILPNGAHAVQGVELKTAEFQEAGALILKLRYVEALELISTPVARISKSGELEEYELQAPEADAELAFIFNMNNKYGQGDLKHILLPIRDMLGEGSTLREVAEAVPGLDMAIVTKLRKNKNDPTSPYMGIESLTC